MTRQLTTMAALVILACGDRPPHSHPAREVLMDRVGTYHLDDDTGAYNVSLEKDGTYYATACTCGDVRSGKGRADHLLDRVILLPEHGGSPWWPIGFSRHAFLAALLDEHGFVIRGSAPTGTPMEQRWWPGRVCAVCNGKSFVGLRTCNAPLPRQTCEH
jgi:hypothetical protein